jgi:hypothetical protein
LELKNIHSVGIAQGNRPEGLAYIILHENGHYAYTVGSDVTMPQVMALDSKESSTITSDMPSSSSPKASDTDDMEHTYTLYPTSPNPFSDRTSISYFLPEESTITVDVYNVIGIRIPTEVQQQKQAVGRHSTALSARGLSSGTYIVRLSCVNKRDKPFVATQLIQVVK